MITLRAERLHWIADDGQDDPTDLCSHSPVTFHIGPHAIVSPGDGDWTVSASAIFLLRALHRDHTRDSPVGEHIFPCCGHVIYDTGTPDTLISGCPSGIDFEIRRHPGAYHIHLHDGRTLTLPEDLWQQAVFRFSDHVRAFHLGSRPKQPAGREDRKGYASMITEWDRLRSSHPAAEPI